MGRGGETRSEIEREAQRDRVIVRERERAKQICALCLDMNKNSNYPGEFYFSI